MVVGRARWSSGMAWQSSGWARWSSRPAWRSSGMAWWSSGIGATRIRTRTEDKDTDKDRRQGHRTRTEDKDRGQGQRTRTRRQRGQGHEQGQRTGTRRQCKQVVAYGSMAGCSPCYIPELGQRPHVQHPGANTNTSKYRHEQTPTRANTDMSQPPLPHSGTSVPSSRHLAFPHSGTT